MCARTLSDEQVQTLRCRYPFTRDTRPIIELAHERGWAEANLTYLKSERERGAQAMHALMREVGLEGVESTSQAVDLIVLAYEVFAPEEGFHGSLIRESDHQLRIVLQPCPEFLRLEEKEWCGVTACTSWHRRHGWYDALGVVATDTIETESGWGDPGCVTLIDVQALRTDALRPHQRAS